ncbi:ATP-binding cassette domain-containing protein [Burkholderia cepacia]|uniref:ATP-binding cassette domain-containing protein n=1 Tax=Burkholderia cepacia TaxID=292 RepID=UPI000F5B6706|nr:ATP-binding cassette domain-containing protein [Burkholderia cepacia]RQT94037.1 ATP-binding cassette domain-containing protein [Burkholderia cepacia]
MRGVDDANFGERPLIVGPSGSGKTTLLGVIPGYVQLLVADVQYHQARLAWLQAVAQRLQDTVAFYVALGGGWGDPG